ncbi:MAG: flagellin [Alphaproteobacteria bacterium]|nr:flagellin [Alphaproteobacteria bacterium]
MVSISTSGLIAQSILQIRDAQATLSDLSNQLSTGKKSIDFTDFTLTETSTLLDVNTSVDKSNSYLNVINVISPRLKLYETSLTKLSSIASDALASVNTNDFNSATNAALGQQLSSYLSDVGYYLNQKVGERFIFAGTGTRLTTAPVVDLTTLPVPPVAPDTAPVTSPTLPTSDTAAPGSDVQAYTHDSTNIDDGYNITYGVTSTDTGMQNLILGLRWAYAATQSSANFTTYMATARTLLTNAVPQLRDIQAQIASNQNRLSDVTTTHKTLINDLTNRAADIQGIDSAEVAAKISFTQSKLEASYSVTAKIAQLSITKYL